jgi:YaaC-like Protein
MAMKHLNLIGSYQSGQVISTESPLEEAWASVSKYGSGEYSNITLKPVSNTKNWNKCVSYASVRVRQAIELRKASNTASLLTSSIPLYYAFLNVLRALLALGPEVIPKPSHGLRFIESPDIFDSKAKLSKGSFTDYLDILQIPWTKDDEITLKDCFLSIPELGEHSLDYFGRNGYTSEVALKGFIGDKQAELVFFSPVDDFDTQWEAHYPNLAAHCTLSEENKNVLLLSKEHSESYETISRWASTHLLPRLYLSETSIWHCISEKDHPKSLPRSCYYYIGAFILSNIARYQPELLLTMTEPDSMYKWIVERFLKHAERYYPQLKMMEWNDCQIYYSNR